ncbi:hypothetical protein N8796_00855 [Candidatus Pelagibacter sp.]|nr:hypothetical protein [Candidatus Pelagibacter sp.]
MIFLLLNIAYYILKKKKISKIIIFVIYPFIGAIAYSINGYSNEYQESIIIHHFITLLSFFLYFTLVESNKIFNYQFKELILKIILIFIFIYFLFNILPSAVIEIYNGNDLRTSFRRIVLIYGTEINVTQNVNGQTKFLFVLLVFLMCLFKKFLPKKKIISLICFMTSILLISIILLTQARLNVFASILFSFFLIINIKDLNFKKKLGYLLITIIVPLFLFNIYEKAENRFNNKYQIYVPPYQKLDKFVTLEKKINNKQVILNDVSQEILLNKLKDESFSDAKLVDLINKAKDRSKVNFLETSSEKIIKNKTSQKKILTHISYDNYLENVIALRSLNNYISISNNDEKILLKKLFKKLHDVAALQKEFIMRGCSKFLQPLDTLLSGRVCGWEILLNIMIVDKVFMLGKGFLADQFYLKHLEKVASNSFINILFNTGVVSLLIYIIFISFFFIKYFKFRNLNHENLYVSISHYYFLYFIFRSFFEDTIAFVSIDLLLLAVSSILIKHNHNHINT